MNYDLCTFDIPMKSRLLGQLVFSLNALLAKVLHRNQSGVSTRPSETNYDDSPLYGDYVPWNFKYGVELYFIRLVEETEKEGFIGFELMRTQGSLIEAKRVGRILYWEASGQFTFETFDWEVPIQVMEALIAEAKRLIKQ